MHDHCLILGFQAIEKGFLSLMLQITFKKHIGMEFLKLNPDSQYTLIVIFGGFVIALLNTVKLVE